ncbi:MAG: Do family serine endopeptidase, partial [Limnobacter sp.]|nr:Do family serine endopeptidase [Limnobacter sp.]
MMSAVSQLGHNAMARFVFIVTIVCLWAAPAAAQTSLQALPDFSGIVEDVGPSVVNIRTTQKVGGGPMGNGMPGFPGLDPNDPFFEFFKRFMPPGAAPMVPQQPRRPQPEREVPRGVGSGFIIDSDGYLLTNHHVVDGAESIIVTLTDEREFKAKIIGSDQRTDVALIKIEGKNLPTVRIGDVKKTKVGQWVVAIGSPFGLENTVTAGIVSAKARDTGEYTPFIQTDVAVNPGNSGGPLLNLDGQVIGINSQIYSRTGGFMGISFAIPIDEAMRVAQELREFGKVSRGRIGVSIGDVDKEVAEALGLSKDEGALVGAVSQDGPADKAGVLAGDIILEFDGKKVSKASDLPRIVGETAPGSKVRMKIWRKGESMSLKLTVGEFEVASAEPQKPEPKESKPATVNKLGLVVENLTDREKE